MIIEVRQTKANIKQELEAYYNGELRFVGKQSAVSSVFPSHIYKLDGGIQFQSKRKKGSIFLDQMMNFLFIVGVSLSWYILDDAPVKILAAILLFFIINMIPITERVCDIIDSFGERAARFCYIKKSFLNTYYNAKCKDKEYFLYILYHSHYLHISIYLNGRQVAQIDKDLHTVNNKDFYTLYLLDTEAEMADLLTMFILYYDNYNHTGRGKVSYGISKNWCWSFGPNNRFYDKTWVAAHFGKNAN